MKVADNEAININAEPISYASFCRCMSLCQGPGVNCKGCKDQNAKVDGVRAVYRK